jgi:hypothetical protein
MVKSEFPELHVTVVAPPNMGHSTDLIGVCDSKQRINLSQIMACLLPDKIADATGAPIAIRPPEYAKP